MKLKAMILIVLITTLPFPIMHAKTNENQHIREIGEVVLQKNYDTLISKKTLFGSIRWSYIQGDSQIINIEGDRISKGVLRAIYSDLDHDQLDQKSKYHLKMFVKIVSNSDHSGIFFEKDYLPNDFQTFSFNYKIVDPCTEHIKVGGYKRDRWTNYIQGAGIIASVLSTGYVTPSIRTCHYDDKAKFKGN